MMMTLGDVSGARAVKGCGDGPLRTDGLMLAESARHLFHDLPTAGRIVELQH